MTNTLQSPAVRKVLDRLFEDAKRDDEVRSPGGDGFSYESATSRRLAEIVQDRLPLHIGVADGGTLGIALPILRETQMPAIEIQLGTPAIIVQRTIDLARMLVEALATWSSETPL